MNMYCILLWQTISHMFWLKYAILAENYTQQKKRIHHHHIRNIYVCDTAARYQYFNLFLMLVTDNRLQYRIHAYFMHMTMTYAYVYVCFFLCTLFSLKMAYSCQNTYDRAYHVIIQYTFVNCKCILLELYEQLL
jgi:hypothetical protein